MQVVDQVVLHRSHGSPLVWDFRCVDTLACEHMQAPEFHPLGEQGGKLPPRNNPTPPQIIIESIIAFYHKPDRC